MKIDQKCLSLCAEVDCFLSLEVLKKGYATPTDFWKELDSGPDTVSSYLMCLITKLISLDTGHGMRALPEVYRELAEMPVDITKLKYWCGSEKPIPDKLRNAALELQHKIISTIHFIKEFYGYVSSTHLRHMYLVWNLARNTSFDGTRKAADFFEEKASDVNIAEAYQVVYPFYMWPLAYAESAKKTLDVVLLEIKSRGSAFRRRMLVEQDLHLTTDKMVRHQAVHIMVDMSLADAKAPLLFEIFNNKQEKLEPFVLKKLLIRNVFKSVFPTHDVLELEHKLQEFSPDVIHTFASMALEKMEEAAAKGSDIDVQNFLSSELNKLHHMIMQYPAGRRDSITAVNSPGDGSHSSFSFPSELSEDLLGSFSLPVPYVHTHALSSSHVEDVSTKLREVITKCQQSDHPSSHSKSDILDQLKTLASTSHRTNGAGAGDQVMSPDLDRACSPSSDSLSVEELDAMRCGSALSKNSTQSEDTGPAPSDLTRGDACALPQTLTERGSVSSESSKSPDPYRCNNRADTPDEGSSKGDSLVGSRRGSKAETPKSIQDNDSVSAYIDCVFELDGSVDDCDTPRAESILFRTGSVDTTSIITTDSTKRKPHPSLKRRDTELSIRTPQDSKPVAIIGRSGEGSMRNKRYGMVSSSNGTSGQTTLRVKPRSNPTATLSMKKAKRPELSTGVFSPAKKVNTKMVKLILAGNDTLVTSVADAYTRLLMSDPSIFSGLEVLFYYIPLSHTSTAYGHMSDVPQVGAGSGDLPEPFNTTADLTGNTIHIARFLSYMDSWYERNVMLAVHNTLRIIPTDKLSSIMQRYTSPLEGDPTTTPRGPLHPSKVLLNIVSSYCREAAHTVRVKMLKVKLSTKTDKSKIIHQEFHMMYRLDIQRLTGKKTKDRQVKTFDANVTITQLALDGSLIRSEMREEMGVWIVRASNIPRAGDPSVCNPESESFELSIIQATAEGGRLGSTKYRFAKESLYHAYNLILETRDKPISVMIDGNTESVIDNVVRMDVSPVYSESTSTSRHSDRQERQVFFPLMTFWPVDL